jgi:hypothetical protein
MTGTLPAHRELGPTSRSVAMPPRRGFEQVAPHTPVFRVATEQAAGYEPD